MSKEQGQYLLSRSCYTHGHGKADGGDNCKVNFYYQLQLYIIFDGDVWKRKFFYEGELIKVTGWPAL